MKQTHFVILVTFVVLLNILFGFHPHADRLTWALENLPVWLGLILIVVTRRLLPLSELCYLLLLVHSIILMVGGYYTYAEEPLFSWLRDEFHWDRNYYDRLGHFVQGFVPAIFVRELLIRTSHVGRGKWLAFLCVAICLAFSALFEIWEWRVAVLGGNRSIDYLGTQGDPWDTQWDMCMALIGAIVSMCILARTHDASLKILNQRSFVRNAV
jgi:putative membrane protein